MNITIIHHLSKRIHLMGLLDTPSFHYPHTAIFQMLCQIDDDNLIDVMDGMADQSLKIYYGSRNLENESRIRKAMMRLETNRKFWVRAILPSAELKYMFASDHVEIDDPALITALDRLMLFSVREQIRKREFDNDLYRAWNTLFRAAVSA